MADRAFLWVQNCRSLNEKTIIEPSYGKIWWYLADQLFALAFGCGKQFICWPLAYHDKLLNLVQELLIIKGEKLNYKSVAKEIWKPRFLGSWSPVGTESLPCLFDSRFL